MLHFFSCRPHALTLDELGNLWPGCRIADTRANPGVVAFSARWPDKAARLSRLAPEQLDLALHDLLEQLRLLALAGGDVLPDLPAMLQRSQFLYALELGAGWAAPGVSQVAVPLASATASLHEVGPYLLDPNGAPLLHRSAEGEPAAGPDLFSAVLLLPGPEIPSAERIRAWLPAADVGIDEDGDTVLHYGEGRSVALIHLRDDAYDQYLGQARQVFAYQSAGEPRRLEGRVAEVLAEPGQVLALQSQSIDRPTYLETLRVLAEGLDPVVFFEGVFEDVRRRPLFVPPEPDPEAPSLPNQEPSAPATERQLARRERSRARLAPKAVPEIEGHDLFVPDDREVELRTPQEAAKRAMILAVVALRAQGFPMTQLEGALVNRHHDLRPSLSPEEQAFLAQDEPDPEQAEMLVWRHESVQTLLFALGHLPDLPWPSGGADMDRLIPLVQSLSKDPEFTRQSVMRPRAAILDALDLTFRQHWAVRQMFVQQQPMPADFDWTSAAPRLPVPECPAAGVLFERHRTLNWLIRFADADWDDVPTPT